MIFSWFKQRQRRRILAEPFPDAWEAYIHRNVYHQRHLNEEQRAKLNRLVQVFVAEKNWEGCGGLTMTEEMKVTIAAQACLLVVGMTEDIHFDHVMSILVYPRAYIAPDALIGELGIVEVEQVRLGEAWYRGPVVLSWEDVLAGGRLETPEHHLVLHEFAHQLDMISGGSSDGIPPLSDDVALQRWTQIMEVEFQELVSACENGEGGILDCYGATNEAEFFAVATETFFQQPKHLRADHPQLYALLRDYFRLDPASWSKR